jgi:hypothetical protein
MPKLIYWLHWCFSIQKFDSIRDTVLYKKEDLLKILFSNFQILGPFSSKCETSHFIYIECSHNTLSSIFSLQIFFSLQDIFPLATNDTQLLLSTFCHLSKFVFQLDIPGILEPTPIFHLANNQTLVTWKFF